MLALDQDPELAALTDEEVLQRAAAERRIVITRNLRHFVPMLRRRAEAGESHAGCILVTLPPNAFGPIVRSLDRLLHTCPKERDWIDRAAFLE